MGYGGFRTGGWRGQQDDWVLNGRCGLRPRQQGPSHGVKQESRVSDHLLRMLTVHREESGLWRVWVPAAGGPVSRLPQGSRTKMTDGKGSRYGTGWGVRIAGA